MNIQLARRVHAVKPSPTLAVTTRARELKAKGHDIISLGAGEPDFDTPDHIKEAAISAIHQGKTKYTAVDGTPELKNAIISKFSDDNKLDYEPEQILVSCGGKQSFFNLSLALLNPGDEVIIPAPYWVSYPDIVKIAEATPVFIPADESTRFKITPEQLSASITSKTRLVVLNSPSNPSGMAYSQQELENLADVLLKHPNIIIATDDMYEHILWGEQTFCNILMACPDLYDRTVVLNGVSKAYSMTGWRIGYAAGPSSLIKTMTKIQSQSTSNPCSISQAAACAALEGPQDCVNEMVQAFKQRHDYLIPALDAIDGISTQAADGTFYCFANFSSMLEKLESKSIHNDVELAEYLLMQSHVALVPGSAFGLQNYMRLSFATSMDVLTEALKRLKNIAI